MFRAALGARAEGEAAAATSGPRPGEEPGGTDSRIWAVLLAAVGCILLIESLLANRVLLGARAAPQDEEPVSVVRRGDERAAAANVTDEELVATPGKPGEGA